MFKETKSWLEVSDEVWVLPNSENSEGTRKELEVAKKLRLPIIYIVK